MTIKKVDSGWRVDIKPGGRAGRRISKTLPTKGEALAWETWAKSNALKTPAWQPEKADHRPLSQLIKLWFDTHGRELRSGETQKARLDDLCEAMGNPSAAQLTAARFAEYRTKRLAAKTAQKNTLNHEHAYLRSMINRLKDMGEWKGDNPIAALKQFKVKDIELTYLDDAQIDRLLEELKASSNRHALPCTKLALATGLRWTEAEEIHVRQVRDRLVTVPGKNFRNRSLPISPELEAELLAHHDKTETKTRLFGNCYGAFREAIERAKIELPAGQLAHVTRHTFASHFLKGGGSIITLQRALDHSDLKVTMRYAHLAPDHLEQVLSFNPLARLYPRKVATDPQPDSAEATQGTVQPRT
jgi:integrase